MGEEPVIDHSVLEKLYKLGGLSFLDKMISLFHENSHRKINEAFDGLKEEDLKQVERAVHSLVSTAGNLGALRMMNIAMNAEREAGKGNHESIPTLLNSLKNAYEEASARLADKKKGFTS